MILAGAGQKRALLNGGTFPQQINPFNNTPGRGDKYGPMILSLLELTALRVGIVPRPERGMLWSCWHEHGGTEGGATGGASTFAQTLGTDTCVCSPYMMYSDRPLRPINLLAATSAVCVFDNTSTLNPMFAFDVWARVVSFGLGLPTLVHEL